MLELRQTDLPQPGAGEVLVQVRAAGVNRGELIGRPHLRLDNPAARPRPSGNEFAGEIVAVGEGVDGWSVGDRVMGRGAGCHADYTIVPARALWSIPPRLSFPEAAALPNVVVTAHDAMLTNAALTADEAVLITAGSSGVGSAAIQIARHVGASPLLVTTRSAGKSAALLALGATDVIDTTQAAWPSRVRELCGQGVQVVIDQVGGSLFPGLLQSMALQGRYVSVGRNDGALAEIDLDLVARNRLRLIGVTFRTRTAEETLQCSERCAADLADAIHAGTIRPVLDRVFPLEALPEAHTYMLSNQQCGKIVLSMT
jgi:NADPH:quinone reductase-like Zn-dependent oxidoreductase